MCIRKLVDFCTRSRLIHPTCTNTRCRLDRMVFPNYVEKLLRPAFTRSVSRMKLSSGTRLNHSSPVSGLKDYANVPRGGCGTLVPHPHGSRCICLQRGVVFK